MLLRFIFGPVAASAMAVMCDPAKPAHKGPASVCARPAIARAAVVPLRVTGGGGGGANYR